MTRSDFLIALAGAAVADSGCSEATIDPLSDTGDRPLIDFHVHLFGIGDGDTGCYMSAKQQRHPTYLYLTRLLRLPDSGVDEAYLSILVGQLRASAIDQAVLLAQDCRYDSAGKADLESTSFYVPNEYVLKVCGRYPDLFIPCVSINPRRPDAMEELEKCADAGARVLKIHPPVQNVDPGEERFRPFYRRCLERRIIVMVHTGTEHSAEIVGDEYSDPIRLVTALEEGCTVVASHCGTGAFFDREDFFPHLIDLVSRYPHLYCDTSIMASMFRWRTIRRLIETPDVLQRAIHASDFPFPSNAVVHWSQTSPRVLLQLAAEKNLLDRDYFLKRALGLPFSVFTKGAELLSAQ